MEERQPEVDKSEDELPAWDATQTRILDAADALISRRGVHGVTIAELARRSELSRPTIYRSWSDADDVVRSALLRRVIGLIEMLPPDPARTRASVVDAVMRFITLFRGDTVYARLLADEPEAFTRYTLQRVGSSQRRILRWLAAAIAAAQTDGSVRADPAGEIAVMVLLVAQSAVLSHGTVAELISEAAWERELRTTLDGLLRP
ncbi:TetR/AcrR family transcriptional regulator [Microbacterium sp. Se5.02b]|uniref:TetR/AcrR family transcriptional regulator n=1 Tax=Microbacterium sp. Se5.02b TaxID=2864103 RepID=UPI001C68BA54|nr:TetR/AcrR family transcriptional regulator [Microbacterium sp. Se5.02b]QYM62861.1 TetR/AcrR family transcriptional regulator [Microbacterium sp. Se5.02b]